MLSVKEARTIGINACLDKLGRDFVMAHRHSSTSAYGEHDDCVFCFVGVDDAPSPTRNDGCITLDSHSVFPYRVSCNVRLQDGAIEFVECIVPV